MENYRRLNHSSFCRNSGLGEAPKPDKTTLYKIPSEILADGSATLRPPLCKCATGRPIVAPVAKALVSTSSPPISQSRSIPLAPPPSAWVPTVEAFDCKKLLDSQISPPNFFDRVNLYTQVRMNKRLLNPLNIPLLTP